ncbi:MAG: AcrR family transcriptional regulator [Lentisphaeria bacterium]|jgi:AcrR family transcriptional regulator
MIVLLVAMHLLDADIAGVSIGTLYEYFPGNESIFAALRLRLNEQMFSVLVKEIGDIYTMPMKQAIEAIVQARISRMLANPTLHLGRRDT